MQNLCTHHCGGGVRSPDTAGCGNRGPGRLLAFWAVGGQCTGDMRLWEQVVEKILSCAAPHSRCELLGAWTTLPGLAASGPLLNAALALFHSSCLPYHPNPTGCWGGWPSAEHAVPGNAVGGQSTVLGARRTRSPSGSAPDLLCSFGRGTVLLGPPCSYPQNKALDPNAMGALMASSPVSKAPGGLWLLLMVGLQAGDIFPASHLATPQLPRSSSCLAQSRLACQ